MKHTTVNRKGSNEMSAHTPGPWFKSHSPDYFANGATVVRHGNERSGLVVAVLPNLRQLDANARLIAAAPALLEALERIIYTPDMERADITDIARAAIAQAKEEK